MEHIVTIVEKFDVPIGKVWAVISSIGAEKAWMPGVKDCSLKGVGPGAVRTLTFEGSVAAGRIACEHIEVLDPESHTVVYRLEDPAPIPAVGCVGTMRLTELGPDESQLEWTGEADAITGDKEKLADAVASFYQDCAVNIRRFIGGPFL